jgi:cytochrome c biogenesis protein CcmG, thiol:disulfide interchange protein DsbE
MVFTLVLGLVWELSGGASAAASPVHKKAPEFVRTDLDNGKVDLARYRGKVVLLNFWATWCAPCELEMPTFVKWQSMYGARGLRVIGISMDDDPDLARKAYVRLKLNYPVAMGDAELGELFGGVLGLPVTYLIDGRGEIRARFQGEADLKEIGKQMVTLLPRR